ncbi:MAG: hypothetical protein Q7T33_04195 [Dehalococcoidia bacterium]|nr:hypothetical protein [Dehalococcoidia bacterium]
MPTGRQAQPPSFALLAMRAWMWLVPIAMLAAAAVFGAIAALDGRWALFVVMLFMGALGLTLLVVHWWLMYRFGGRGP